ncbi:MAG TPA: hypothetical protein VHO70_21470 [Chitinispirillaceae bacterium]|nr:hypothetical protein [Chitinispirillaceae bacterium]
MPVVKLIICIMFLSMLSEAEQLAGDLPRYISADKSPYHVVADIYVPSGKVVEVEPGTVFLFKNFTGLHIQGVLNAKGTLMKDIVFTSINDEDYNKDTDLNPTPYDWNGIYIHKDGIGTDLERVKVRYSVKGILSETKFIRLSEVLFHDNGRANLTIENETKPVAPEMPYSYNLSLKDAVVDGVPAKILMDPHAKVRNIIRYTGLLCFIGSGGVTAYYTNETVKDLEDFRQKSIKLNQNSSIEEIRYLSGDSTLWVQARDEKDKSIQRMIIGYIGSLLGLTAFSLSFTF